MIARTAYSGHSKASGIPISGRVFEVFFIQRGLIARWEQFTDRAEALQAAGVDG